jgi:16S rRNA (uracil1498-N3)-methyltransferase
MPRFYCPELPSSEATLAGDELHHLRTVRRLGPGDEVELFDGRGRLARCRLVSLDRRRAEFEVLDLSEAPAPTVQLAVATAIGKGGRMETLVEKVTELGAAGIWPLVTERSDVTARGAERQGKWRRRAVEAAKQCEQLHLPEIANVMSLDEAIARLAADPPATVLLTDPSPEAPSAHDLLSTKIAASVDSAAEVIRIVGFVGPEGGFTDEEIARLRAAGATPVRLAPHILRIETAAIALAATVAQLYL